MARKLTAEMTTPVVDGQAGVMSVTIENTDSFALKKLKVGVQPSGNNAPGTLFQFIPSPQQRRWSYRLKILDAGESATLPFAVIPIDAETGRTYEVEVAARWQAYDEDTRSFVPQVPTPVRLKIHLEARPEVYLAIGAADVLRRTLLQTYEALTQSGRDSHSKARTTLPSTPSDPARTAFGENSFDWAMSMVELGSRLYRNQARSQRRTRS